MCMLWCLKRLAVGMTIVAAAGQHICIVLRRVGIVLAKNERKNKLRVVNSTKLKFSQLSGA